MYQRDTPSSTARDHVSWHHSLAWVHWTGPSWWRRRRTSVTRCTMLISLRDHKYPNITLFKANLYVSYCTITVLRPQSEKQNLMAGWESRPILIWNVVSLIPRPDAGYLRLGVFLLSMRHYININYSWAMSFHSFVNSPSTTILHGKMYTLHS